MQASARCFVFHGRQRSHLDDPEGKSDQRQHINAPISVNLGKARVGRARRQRRVNNCSERESSQCPWNRTMLLATTTTEKQQTQIVLGSRYTLPPHCPQKRPRQIDFKLLASRHLRQMHLETRNKRNARTETCRLYPDELRQQLRQVYPPEPTHKS